MVQVRHRPLVVREVIWYGVGTLLNDIWLWDESSTEWTWLGGNENTVTVDTEGFYGTLGVESAQTTPQALWKATAATDDAGGKFYLFGGQRLDVNGNGMAGIRGV